MGVSNVNAGRTTISTITTGELFHDADRSAKSARNLAVVEQFASLLEVLPCTAMASQHGAAIRSAPENAGRPIGVSDLHIAALARNEGLPLVTNNLDDFQRVHGLLTANRLAAA